jgi:hypothetical protein
MDCEGKEIEVYMDDIVVHSKSIVEHDQLLKKLFEKLSEYKMRVNLEEIQFREK